MRSEIFLNQTLGHWPGREDLSDELKRLVGSLPDGCADLAECLATARRIDVNDEDS